VIGSCRKGDRDGQESSVGKGWGGAGQCRGLTAKLLDDVERDLASTCLEKLKKLNLHFAIRVPGIGEISVAKHQQDEDQVTFKRISSRQSKSFGTA